jgi:hypothetical protein
VKKDHKKTVSKNPPIAMLIGLITGNLILLLVSFLVLSWALFHVFGGIGATSEYRYLVGLSIKNPFLFGIPTYSFFHENFQHIWNNTQVAILLLFVIMLEEWPDPRLVRIDLIRYFLCPFLSISIVVLLYAWLFSPSSSPGIGLSLLMNYFSGFVLLIGMTSVLKPKSMPLLMRVFLFLFLLVLLLEKIYSPVMHSLDFHILFEDQHTIGFVIGLFAGWTYLKK